MAVKLEDSSEQIEQKLGDLVAVEGDCQVVSTQLRLLPPSSKILVLPPLIDDVRKRSEETQFNARTFVRDVHSAFTTRTETARSFLASSSSEQPRLVFMNGGSVCAKTTCITNICESVTNGNIREAEELFQEIVKDGVAGLMRPDVLEEQPTVEKTDADRDDAVEQEGKRSSSDAGSVAMKAADDLDRDTADLQPSNDGKVEADAVGTTDHATAEDVKEPIENSKGDTGVPEATEATSEIKESSSQKPDKMADKTPINIAEGDTIRRTIISLPDRNYAPITEEDENAAAEMQNSALQSSSSVSKPLSQDSSANLDPDVVFSPTTDYQQSQPATPGATVEYGEARIVDVQSGSPPKTVNRVRSLGMLFEAAVIAANVTSPGLKRAASYQDLRKKTLNNTTAGLPRSKSSFDTLPRSEFVRASTTTIRRSPTLKGALFTPPRVYVDRGSDAVVEEEVEMAEEFQPVFPVVEDLIIYFSSTNNEIFEAVIRAYKDESYPVIPTKPESPTEPVAPVEPPSEEETSAEAPRPFSNMTNETDDDGYHQEQEEVDPYNPDSYQAGQRMWPRQPKIPTKVQPIAEPLTPATTPPPTLTPTGQKFYEFSPINSNSALGIQNSLRAVLKTHFGPPETTKYRQYDVPMECDRFWKPVFRDDDGQGNEGRTVDLILGMGCEDGVSKEFLTEITGQIEKLGTKKSGISRSVKLDIRYLIASAMQNHTSQSLTAQSTSNPFGNPVSLATAIISQLETYLAVNSSTRFLVLTYPAQHLPTILSLRKLLGSDLFKVAGIIDALGASDPPSFSARSKTPPPALNLLSNEATLNPRHKPSISIGSFARTRAELARQASAAHSYSISTTSSKHNSAQIDPLYSFAKANFLLPSTATDAEIATFLSSIWKTLIEKSNWYAPEPVTPTPEPVAAVPAPPPIPPTPANETADKAPLSPSGASHSVSHRPKKSSLGSRSKIDQMLGNNAPTRSTAAPVSSQTDKDAELPPIPRGNNIVNSGSNGNFSEKERRDDKAWENFYLGPEGESDDEYERMLMPRLPKRTEKKKGNSRKALKWLGLA